MLKAILSRLYTTVAWPILPNGLYCFNYHRIGDHNESDFDPNVFSCTEAQFEKHVTFYNQHFTVISVEQLIEMYNKNQPLDKKYALITFDDGYIDNYSLAFPILKRLNTPAAFYIATDYLDDPHIPWWDEIAWIIRHSKQTVIKLSNWNEAIDIANLSVKHQIRAILKAIKKDQSRTMEDKIQELSQVCDAEMPAEIRESQLFVNWQQVEEMANSGMHIGSHTMSHNILSHLEDDAQHHEVSQSKSIIEKHIGKPVTSIAYPVGGSAAFNSKTINAAKNADYNVAFSFIPGIETELTKENQFQIHRLPVDDNCTVEQLKTVVVRNK